MNYRESLHFLAQRGYEVTGTHLGLERIQALMDAFGNPQDRFGVIHIAGTNGKGSVAAMLESILIHSGTETGLYTSPHLVRVEERIRVRGRQISPRRFASLLSKVARVEQDLLSTGRLDLRLTYFELLTACAFVHFAEEKIEIAVVEVGLGGRLDATNVVRPKVCIITTVSYDHQEWLGYELSQIAKEKAGIIKRGVPVVSGCRSPAVRRAIRESARKMRAPLVEIDRTCSLRISGVRRGRFVIDLETRHGMRRNLRPALRGLHQTRNAAMAISALELLPCIRLRTADLRRGLAGTRWPGRMEEFHIPRRTILDGAHNPEAVRLLRGYLKMRNCSEVHLVFGAMKDKDTAAMARLLFPLARSIHLTRVSNPRTARPEDISAQMPAYRNRIRIHGRPRDALRAAQVECSRRGWIVVTGSLYLVGELRPEVQANAEFTRG